MRQRAVSSTCTVERMRRMNLELRGQSSGVNLEFDPTGLEQMVADVGGSSGLMIGREDKRMGGMW